MSRNPVVASLFFILLLSDATQHRYNTTERLGCYCSILMIFLLYQAQGTYFFWYFDPAFLFWQRLVHLRALWMLCIFLLLDPLSAIVQCFRCRYIFFSPRPLDIGSMTNVIMQRRVAKSDCDAYYVVFKRVITLDTTYLGRYYLAKHGKCE
jgi:hypothetical protein